jgi:hypothetical protein
MHVKKGLCPKYGRYWVDQPGQHERLRKVISLGEVTQTMAERKLRDYIRETQVDSPETFEEVTNIVRDNLHPALLTLKQPRAGFHCFRRFRESVLQMSDARNLLVDYWMGHENREMGTRYAKQLIENIQWRKEWAEKIGLGFKLPTLESSVGLLGLPKQQKSKLEKVA